MKNGGRLIHKTKNERLLGFVHEKWYTDYQLTVFV